MQLKWGGGVFYLILMLLIIASDNSHASVYYRNYVARNDGSEWMMLVMFQPFFCSQGWVAVCLSSYFPFSGDVYQMSSVCSAYDY